MALTTAVDGASPALAKPFPLPPDILAIIIFRDLYRVMDESPEWYGDDLRHQRQNYSRRALSLAKLSHAFLEAVRFASTRYRAQAMARRDAAFHRAAIQGGVYWDRGSRRIRWYLDRPHSSGLNAWRDPRHGCSEARWFRLDAHNELLFIHSLIRLGKSLQSITNVENARREQSKRVEAATAEKEESELSSCWAEAGDVLKSVENALPANIERVIWTDGMSLRARRFCKQRFPDQQSAFDHFMRYSRGVTTKQSVSNR